MNYLKGFYHITLSGGKKETIPAFKAEATVYRRDNGMEIVMPGQFQVEMTEQGNPMILEGVAWAI